HPRSAPRPRRRPRRSPRGTGKRGYRPSSPPARRAGCAGPTSAGRRPSVRESDELGHPRDCRRRDGVGAEAVVLRAEVFLGGEGLLPGDRLAGIGGHPAHDRHERALAHPLAVVDRLARADAGEELVVLLLVHVALALAPGDAPALLALDHPGAP